MLVSGRVDFWCVASFFVARCHIQVLQENREASRRRPEAQGGPGLQQFFEGEGQGG